MCGFLFFFVTKRASRKLGLRVPVWCLSGEHIRDFAYAKSSF